MKRIDDFLNTTTMYRLVLYYLVVLVVVAAFYCAVGILPYNLFFFSFSVLFLIIVGWITNTIFAKTFEAPTNVESVYISSLILALIITPATTLHNFIFLGWAAVLTMASKYIFAIGKKHIGNPVAVAMVMTGLAINQSASWWVGTVPMLPFVLIGGVLIVRKIRRLDLVFSFFCAAATVILSSTILKGGNLFSIAQKAITDSPLLFFAFVMLTEPLTTPPTRILQISYGLLVGILFAPQFHIGSWVTTPEIALVIGNLYSYAVSPKQKLILTLKEKVQIAPDIYDFIFNANQPFSFTPGQYMEWTLAHDKPDDRGNRRYFTLASSPTEKEVRIGIKFYETPSSYKKTLVSMNPGDRIISSQLAGDFTLPKNAKEKLVFIAGGIGVTPFRSMLKYLIDAGEKRDIVMVFANRNLQDIVYKDTLDSAKQLGVRTIYTLTDTSQVPANWLGKVGRVSADMITSEIPDYRERTFYLSGPNAMVQSYQSLLMSLNVDKRNIITDYFPGF